VSLHLRAEYLRLKAASFDPNTELVAVPVVLEQVRALFQRVRAVGLVHIEIDPGSRVETVYGWQVLDGLLKTVSAELGRMQQALFPPGSITCQAGIYADRFLVFLPLTRAGRDSGAGLLASVVNECRQRLAGRFSGAEFRSMTPRPVVAVGGTTVEEHPFHRLERQIYTAIDEARLVGGRGEITERSRNHAELKRLIREQRIETLFQAVVDLETGKVVGFEAFSRGPRDTVFERPAHLFEVSQQFGMAGEVDLLCQRTALRQARRMEGGCKLFLNALPSSLLEPGFRESLLADLPDGFPLGRQDIVLEIADRSSIEDYEAFGTEVTDLRAMGFKMSIDDVGKGSTSLESLTEIKPDYIKVDTSLIRNIHSNLIKQELLRSLCQVAKTMDCQVIAEGIETQEELTAVRRCGARLGQGYYFQRPGRDLATGVFKMDRGERADAGEMT